MKDMNFEDGVPFDPGYSNYLEPFTPTIKAIREDLKNRRNFSQKKIRFNNLNKMALDILDNNVSFYLGCILWGAYIHKKFEKDPKVIKNNAFLKADDQELNKKNCFIELDSILDFINNYPRDTKYYTGKEQSLPSFYRKIIDSYKDFIEINDNFVNAETTANIKIPENFAFIKDYKDAELEKVYSRILEAVSSGKMAELFNLDLISKI